MSYLLVNTLVMICQITVRHKLSIPLSNQRSDKLLRLLADDILTYLPCHNASEKEKRKKLEPHERFNFMTNEQLKKKAAGLS